ncbi:MAG: SAM-dependent chlorinase/fluorinase [Planctomycetia bacterium]|jgi:S-adenosylmethionine hydrolase
MSIITLTTDFGADSPYAAAMKGAILSINPEATIVDLTHSVHAQNIREGAVILYDIARQFPDDTIHIAVIDPGVGTDREIVAARIDRWTFIAPDNGLLSLITSETSPTRIVRLRNDAYWKKPVSATFHGRDIMAPVAAHLSLGVSLDELGPTTETLHELEWPKAVDQENRVHGIVREIDSFGNLVTNITSDMLGNRPTDHRACIICEIYETWGIFHAYGDQPRGTLIALVGSNGFLELAIVGESAAERLGVRTGTSVTVAWE